MNYCKGHFFFVHVSCEKFSSILGRVLPPLPYHFLWATCNGSRTLWTTNIQIIRQKENNFNPDPLVTDKHSLKFFSLYLSFFLLYPFSPSFFPLSFFSSTRRLLPLSSSSRFFISSFFLTLTNLSLSLSQFSHQCRPPLGHLSTPPHLLRQRWAFDLGW